MLFRSWRPLLPAGAEGASPSSWIGLSFFVVKQDNATLIGHTGSQAGFLSFFYLNPATGRAVLAAFNTNNAARAEAGSAFNSILREALPLIR